VPLADIEEEEEEEDIQPVWSPITTADNPAMLRSTFVQHTPVPVQFKQGKNLVKGLIYYKVSNSRYLYTIVDTGGPIQKAYLLKANRFPTEAAQLQPYHQRAISTVDLASIKALIILSVAIVKIGDGKWACLVEALAEELRKILVPGLTVMGQRWPMPVVREACAGRRVEQRQRPIKK
jgi:hypothetical protein